MPPRPDRWPVLPASPTRAAWGYLLTWWRRRRCPHPHTIDALGRAWWGEHWGQPGEPGPANPGPLLCPRCGKEPR